MKRRRLELVNRGASYVRFCIECMERKPDSVLALKVLQVF